MGLDMYMKKTKKLKGMTLRQIINTASYIDYLNRPKEYSDCSYYDWCGKDESKVVKDRIEDVRENIYVDRWGFYKVCDKIAYWRKANMIHKWFVDNCGDGIDECQLMEVSKDQLEELLETAKKVKDSCELVEGKIKDLSVAKELLPTQSGFFFGSEEYDENYLDDIKYTIEQISHILETTDFENEYITYQASW